MSKPRKIYKRAGIIHICYSGRLWAPAMSDTGSRNSAFRAGDELVILFESEDSITVDGEDRLPEAWAPVDIPTGPSRKPASAKVDSRDGYRVFLPKGFEHPMGLPVYSSLEAAEAACERAIRTLGIPEELWQSEGWGSIHERDGLSPVKEIPWRAP